MNSLNLNNVISTGENTFIIRMSLSELKNIIDFDAIEINCEKDVPYIPLENESIIYLNIDKKNSYYNKQTNVLNVNDKFRVMDGEIRLIDFINNTNWYEDKMDQIVTINIVCCDITQARNLFANIDTIPINTESIKNIANEIKITINDSNDDFSKIITIPISEESRKTIEKLDQAHIEMINKNAELEAKFQEAIEGLKKILESADEEENK